VTDRFPPLGTSTVIPFEAQIVFTYHAFRYEKVVSLVPSGGGNNMNLVALAVLSAVYAFWLWMMVLVHRRYAGSKNERLAMTLTFYSLGVAAPLILLGKERWELPAPGWLRKLGGFSSGAVKRFERRPEGPEEEPGISFIRYDGQPLLPQTARMKKRDAPLTIAGLLLQQAIRERATDVHLEPEPDQLRVRFRIDGVLQTRQSYPIEVAPGIISALKVLAGEDMSERRRGQDGSFSALLDGRSIDFRTATTGTLHGEKMLIRILDRKASLKGMSALGLRKQTYRRLKSLLDRPSGMLIVCGPTGSGKTTTLYAALQETDTIRKNVVTIEDPIEYNLENVTQMNINEKAGITFASLLRATLRQDPDVVMVGEIRDKETAEIAMQAALTGHLVYTTIHANDTVSCIFRLLDLSVRPSLIATAVTAILAQRLVRKLCKNCRVAREATPRDAELLKADISHVSTLYEPVGCERCYGTGYRGRTGVFELLVLDDHLRDLIQRKASITELRTAAKTSGLISLKWDAVAKALRGITSVEEALGVTQ